MNKIVCFKVQNLYSFLELSSAQFHKVLLTPLSSEGLRRQILAGERPSANALSLRIPSNYYITLLPLHIFEFRVENYTLSLFEWHV